MIIPGECKTREVTSSVERVRKAIQHYTPDRIPRGEITLDDDVIKTTLDCDRIGFEERQEFASLLGLDVVCLSPGHPVPVDELPGAADLVWTDLDAWVTRSGLFVFAVLDGPFGWGVRIFGFQRFLTLPLHDPGTWKGFLAQVEKLNVDLAGHLSDRGVHGLILADDIAYQDGLLMGPEATRQMLFPSLAGQAEDILHLGLPLFYHSDGNITNVLPDLAGMGFHGLHCIDSRCGMDPDLVKSQYGEKLCLWGTLTVDDLHRCHSPGGLELLSGTIRETASGGGFILGTTSGIFKGLDLEALRAVYARA